MPKIYNTTSPSLTLVDKWTKNVYSMGKLNRTNGDNLPTPLLLTSQFTASTVHNPLFIPRFIQSFTAQLSTLKNTHFNLLNRRLYPLSTAPINNNEKENLERNT